MLTMILGTDWTANQDTVLEMLSKDIQAENPGRILLVPELITHDTERRLCMIAGNTTSRFAEVLSFSRLTRRICDWANCGMMQCLDNGGRLAAMAAAARQLHGQLKSYASMETRPEFLTALVDAVDEFKRCCIASADLLSASRSAEGAFAQKLEELSLLLEAYEAICAQGKADPRDQLTWGLAQLYECDFAQNHVFYVDGFPDFTRQNMAVLSYLIENSPHVIISLHCDSPGSRKLAFEKAGETAAQIYRIANNAGVPIEIINVAPQNSRFMPVCEHLFQGNIGVISQCSPFMRLLEIDSVYEECVVAAEQIMELVHQGVRYRDISVVCPDLPTYGNALKMHFQLCGIPSYLAGTEDILNKSVISTVLTALDAAIGGFDSKDILRYLHSALSPLSLSECDKLENYVLLWSIQGRKWLQEWGLHPDGLTDEWREEDHTLLAEVNTCRLRVIEPLQKLSVSFHNAKQLQNQVDALYTFFEEIHLAERLAAFADEMDLAGDNRNAQILNQLWDILLSALGQLRDILGESHWDSEAFIRLFRLLLSQYDVGTIPPVLDTVTVGSVSSMRCQRAKHLVIIGAAEGLFPQYAGTNGVLTDQERSALRQMGIPLTGGAAEGLQIEFSEIYALFNGVTESIYVSCPTGQTSFVYRRLLTMAGKVYTPSHVLAAAATNPREAAAFLNRTGDQAAAKDLNLEPIYLDIQEKKQHSMGKITRGNIDRLYGRKLNLSASQIDKQAECRLAYFLKYGLKAKERKPVTVDPAEFGTYIHAVLEETAREICSMGGFKKVTLEQTFEIAKKHSDVYTKEHFGQIDSKRMAYLFQRNSRELMMVVEELWQEFQESAFEPVDFEVAFGENADLDAVQIPCDTMPAQLRGFVDRVDAWKENGRNYYRVVDYKTGRKDFDYCDVFNGLGLQMLLYLFALEQEGECLLGRKPKPAGVQYFPARVPLVSSDGELSDDEAIEERKSYWKRKGLILDDKDVLRAMEDSDAPTRLSCKIKKDGSVSGDVASSEQFKQLCKYVFHVLRKMVEDIASGNVTPNPYTRGSSFNACRFCPYGAVCHTATVEERRNYKAMSAQRFWDEIEKEMSKLE